MLIAPSLLSADFGNLQREIEMLNSSEADYLHIDVMDGVFVPNITFGFPVIKAINAISTLPLDVHLMIVEPQKYVSQIRDCGASLMTVHVEACVHLYRVVQMIRQAGMKVGIAINPGTPIEHLVDIINEIDLVLLMSVNPGFGGQSFIKNTLAKLVRLKKLIADSGSNAIVEVDGGINAHTGCLLAQYGADMLVAGSYVFNSPDPHHAIRALKAL